MKVQHLRMFVALDTAKGCDVTKKIMAVAHTFPENGPKVAKSRFLF